MSTADWIVLIGTLATIVLYGTWKTRKSKDLSGYLLGDRQAGWSTVGLSVMATQASAITFMSTPGMGFDSGMKFVQFYMGLPIALVILSTTIIPLYYKLKVYTAYEFLENRFDLKTRMLTAMLFMIQRGLAAGVTIYAPAIILSSTLGWNIVYTNLLVGILVIIYTVSGGTKAVSLTQKWQMAVIMLGMFVAFGILLHHISEHVSFGEAVQLAGDQQKMKVISWEFDVTDKYNVWAAFTGGIFLFLSYFGTDQSQVQRYISGKSIRESRLGLMFNGIVKVPMQFFIVFIGVMVFVFYQFEKEPVYFDQTIPQQLVAKGQGDSLQLMEAEHQAFYDQRGQVMDNYLAAMRTESPEAKEVYAPQLMQLNMRMDSMAKEVKALAKRNGIDVSSKETDYVFISWVIKYLPVGLVGLLIAVIFSAAMSSTASELNALSSTFTVDYYKRAIRPNASENHYLVASKLFTLGWGILAICFAFLFSMANNLIEVVNIIGSVFYGVILGIFLIGFYIKRIKGSTVFWAGLIAQVVVIGIYYYFVHLPENAEDKLGYLWLNAIGCGLVFLFAFLIYGFKGKSTPMPVGKSA